MLSDFKNYYQNHLTKKQITASNLKMHGEALLKTLKSSDFPTTLFVANSDTLVTWNLTEPISFVKQALDIQSVKQEFDAVKISG